MIFGDYQEVYQTVISDEQHRPAGKEAGETSHV